MGIISWIVVGIAAGWFASNVTGTRHAQIGSLVLGMFTALIAGWITDNHAGDDAGVAASIIVAAVASATLVVIWQTLNTRWR